MKRLTLIAAVFVLGSGTLFSQSINLKIGLFVPSLKSDLWEVNMRNLTFNKSDLTNAYYSGEYEMYFSRHASCSIEIGSYARNIYAQYRDYTFEDGSPIYQDISLRLTPVEVNLKYYPLSHRLRFFPFFGVGVGAYAWVYQQSGNFINFEDDSVDEGFAETRKFSFGFNTRFGLVFRFQQRLALALEGKYHYLKGRLSEYFQGFEPLDLGGFTANVSINIFFD